MKFNREKSKQFTLLECNQKKKIERFGKVVLTSFGVVLILFGTTLNSDDNNLIIKSNNAEKSKLMISNYDIARGEYLERVHQYKDDFEDNDLLEFYKNGKLVVNYNGNIIESNIKALYLRYGFINNNNFIFLSNVLKGRNVDFFTLKNNYYAEDYPIIEFRNTTVFEKFYDKYSSKIVDNVIILNEEETKDLISMMYLWDGKINDMVPETKAVLNKHIWEVVSSGKER